MTTSKLKYCFSLFNTAGKEIFQSRKEYLDQASATVTAVDMSAVVDANTMVIYSDNGKTKTAVDHRTNAKKKPPLPTKTADTATDNGSQAQ